MFGIDDKRLKSGFAGVVALVLVAFEVHSGHASSRYGSGVSSDSPVFWLKDGVLSVVGFYLLFSAMFGWSLFGEFKDRDDDTAMLGDDAPAAPLADEPAAAPSEEPDEPGFW